MVKEERRPWPPGWGRLLQQEEIERVLGGHGPLHKRVLRLSGTQARIALMAVAQGKALEVAVAEVHARERRTGGNASAILGAAERALKKEGA